VLTASTAADQQGFFVGGSRALDLDGEGDPFHYQFRQVKFALDPYRLDSTTF